MNAVLGVLGDAGANSTVFAFSEYFRRRACHIDVRYDSREYNLNTCAFHSCTMHSCAMHFRRFALTAVTPLCAILVLIAGCSTLGDVIESAPKPSARILGAGVRNLSLRSLDLVFDVEVSNPYSVNLPLADLVYTVRSGTQQLVAGSIKPSGSVPAKSSGVMQLPARLDLGAVLETLSGVRPGAVVPYTAEINVIVDAPLLGQMALPLKRKGEIRVPAVPEITLASFDVAELSLDKVNAKARLRIKNTNQFQLDVARLRFDLALGGAKVASTRLRGTSKLAPGQTSIVEIPLSLSPRALGTGVLGLLKGNAAGYDMSGRLDVMTRFGELALPFSNSGETPVRR